MNVGKIGEGIAKWWLQRNGWLVRKGERGCGYDLETYGNDNRVWEVKSTGGTSRTVVFTENEFRAIRNNQNWRLIVVTSVPRQRRYPTWNSKQKFPRLGTLSRNDVLAMGELVTEFRLRLTGGPEGVLKHIKWEDVSALNGHNLEELSEETL